MGIHFDSLEAAKTHLAGLDWSRIPKRIRVRIEKYADGSCLLLIHDPRGVA